MSGVLGPLKNHAESAAAICFRPETANTVGLSQESCCDENLFDFITEKVAPLTV